VMIDMACFGKAADSETVVIDKIKTFTSTLKKDAKAEIPLGLLEAKERRSSPAMLKALLDLGIIHFVVESSGSAVGFQEKIGALGDFKRSLKLFSSNSTVFLASLNMGGSGFIGSQASFAPRIFCTP
jgi:dihydrodipicolinate synthase/N-acetylneuraminate lyase